DGAAGLLISSKEPKNTALQFNQFASTLAFNREKDMAWTIGDHGFEMVLSTYVPDIIRENLQSVLQPLYEQYTLSNSDIDFWAVHPGGQSILDKVEESLQLQPKQIEASRNVLSEYGNMSSATVLFVMQKLLRSDLSSGTKIISMAFGPGLTIESGLFTVYNPS
ncbi:MAG TPA: type III polyketide synthase, partial [Balneolaceae bacterium]|nr:type III polyketide synthase [Balneolaceae bacterium]